MISHASPLSNAKRTKGGRASIAEFITNSLQQSSGMTDPFGADWRAWCLDVFPQYYSDNFGERHRLFWEHIEQIGETSNLPALVAIWPRGSGKSTTVEGAIVRMAAKRVRRYGWYISATQDQADKHVASVAGMLEAQTIGYYYPDLSKRLLDKFGQSEGWKRNLLRCASGFSLEAIGLDKAVRGGKMDWVRPDLIILDDIDGRHDTAATVERKIQIITESILPAGAMDTVVIMVQNLIHKDSIASRLAGRSEKKADFLLQRKVLGPYPAVVGLQTEVTPDGIRIVAGTSTWDGQDLAICEKQINDWGLASFGREAQHDVDDPPGGIWDHIVFKHCSIDETPDIVRGAVWVDPAVTSTDSSDCHAIIADGLGTDGKLYRFFSWEGITSPEDSLRRAILKCVELGFDSVGVESNQGGDLWRSAYNEAWQRLVDNEDYPQITADLKMPRFKEAKAGGGTGSKVHRNSLMLTSYENGRVVHVTGTTHELEKALRRFPRAPLDLADSAFWGWNDILPKVRRPANGKLDY